MSRPLLAPRVLPVCPADLTSPEAVGDRLLNHLHVAGLRYLQAPVPVPNGWETYTFRLQFHPAPALPRRLVGPLLLRVYASPQGLPRARHEFATLEHLWGLGFPVPRPLLLETSPDVLGGPFLLVEYLTGRTLFETLLRRPWRIFDGPGRMAALHARLHSLPVDRFPAPAGSGGPFLHRRLEEIAGLVRAHGLRSLQPGLDWLWLHRPTPGRSLSVLHLDWHPLNLIERPDGTLFAVDWAEADVGDPHADLATTLMLLRRVPTAGGGLWQAVSEPVGRWLTAAEYLYSYKRLRPVDGQRLSYFRAWAVMRRLAGYGRWLRAGPASTGSKPSLLNYLRPGHLAALSRGFRRLTGVEVRL